MAAQAKPAVSRRTSVRSHHCETRASVIGCGRVVDPRASERRRAGAGRSVRMRSAWACARLHARASRAGGRAQQREGYGKWSPGHAMNMKFFGTCPRPLSRRGAAAACHASPRVAWNGLRRAGRKRVERGAGRSFPRKCPMRCERFGAHLEVQRELVDERRREVACSADGHRGPISASDYPQALPSTSWYRRVLNSNTPWARFASASAHAAATVLVTKSHRCLRVRRVARRDGPMARAGRTGGHWRVLGVGVPWTITRSILSFG